MSVPLETSLECSSGVPVLSPLGGHRIIYDHTLTYNNTEQERKKKKTNEIG